MSTELYGKNYTLYHSIQARITTYLPQYLFDFSNFQKVNATLQHDVQSMCTEACHFLGLNITKSAMELLLDVFFHKMTCYADDLERFAK